MRAKVSKVSKVTSILLTILLVSGLAFSVLAYFGNNNGGNDISGGDAIESPVANAGFTTAAPVESFLVSNGATLDSNTGKVTTNADYSKRGGSGAAKTDNGNNSFIPTRYIQLQNYGYYDLSQELYDLVGKDGNWSRGSGLFGIQERITTPSQRFVLTNDTEQITSGSNSAHQGKGLKAGMTGKGDANAFGIYFTMALPNNQVAGRERDVAKENNTSVKVEVDLTTMLWSDKAAVGSRHTRIGATMAIFADNTTTEGGVTADLSSVATADGQMFSNSRNYTGYNGNDYDLKSPASNTTVVEDGLDGSNLLFNQANDGKWGSRFVRTYEVPADTTFLRFVIAFDKSSSNQDAKYQDVNISLTDFKLKVWDDAPNAVSGFDLTEDNKTATNAYNAQYTVGANNKFNGGDWATAKWAKERYVDIRFNPNNGVFTKPEIDSAFSVKYRNPRTGIPESKSLPEIPVLGKNGFDKPGPNDYIYIVDDNIAQSENPYFTQGGRHRLQYDLTGKTFETTLGVNIRLCSRAGAIDIECPLTKAQGTDSARKTINYAHNDGYRNKISGTPFDSYYHLKVDFFAPTPAKTSIGVQKENVAFDVVFDGLERHTETSNTEFYSEDKLYMYELKEGEVVNDLDLAALANAGQTTLVDNLQGNVATLAGMTHGKKKLVFFLKDDADNLALFTEGATDGYYVAYADGSEISTVSATIDKAEHINKWTSDDVTIHVTATAVDPTGHNFLAGQYCYLVSNGELVGKGYLINGTGDIVINTNGNYENLQVMVVNRPDHDDPNVLPMSLAPAKRPFAKVSGNEFVNILRDDATPKFNIGRNSKNSGLFLDNKWNANCNGIVDYVIKFTPEVGHPIFDNPDTPLIHITYNPNVTGSDSNNKKIGVGGEDKYLTLNEVAKGVTLRFGDALGVDDPINGIYNMKGVANTSELVIDDTTNNIISINGLLGIEINYVNSSLVYYRDMKTDYRVKQGVVDTKEKAYDVKLDNVVPEMKITGANYIEGDASGVTAIENIANGVVTNGLTPKPIPNCATDEDWFYGTVGIKLVISNYSKVLSLLADESASPVKDQFKLGDPLVLYEKSSGTNGVNYLTFSIGTNTPKVEIFAGRKLGFMVTTLAGHTSKVSVNTPEGNPIVMNYDNILPSYTITIDGKDVTNAHKVDSEETPGLPIKWYSKDALTQNVNITDTTTGVKATITAKYLEGNATQVLPSGNYQGTLGDLLDAEGKFTYIITAENPHTHRTVITKFNFGRDTLAEAIEVNGWETKANGIKYVTTAKYNQPMTIGTITSPVVENGYKFYLSPDQLTEDQLASVANLYDTATALTASKVENGASTFTIDVTTHRGKNFIYFLSKDTAGNISINDVSKGHLHIVMDERDKTFTIYKTGNGTVNYSATNAASTTGTLNQTASIAGDLAKQEIALTMKVGESVNLTVEAALGSKFLGYVNAEDDIKAPLSMDYFIDIVDQEGNLVVSKTEPTFKKIVTNFVINNNIQAANPENTYAKPAGTVNVGTAENHAMDTAATSDQIFEVLYNNQEGDVDGKYTEATPPTQASTTGKFKYRISIAAANKGEYWIDSTSGYVEFTLLVAEGKSINLVFDAKNATKEYEYIAGPIIGNSGSTMVGDFITNFVTYADATIIDTGGGANINVNNALKHILSTNIAFNPVVDSADLFNVKLTSVTPGKPVNENEVPVDEAVSVGEYKLYISGTNTVATVPEVGVNDYEADLNGYKIDFAMTFNIVPRIITIEKKDVPVKKTYDGNVDVVAANDAASLAWNTYFTVGNLVGKEDIATEMSKTGLKFTFKFDNANVVSNNIATFTMTKSADYSNYNIASHIKLVFNDANITPRPLTVQYNNVGFKKNYDGNTDVNITANNPLRKLAESNTNADAFWYSTDLVSKDIIYIDIPLAFNACTVADANAINASGAIKILNADGITENTNYTIASVPNITTGVAIERTEVKVTSNDTSTKDFDGKQIVVDFKYDGIIGEEKAADVLTNGIPNVIKDNVKFMLGSEAAPDTWDAGVYTITFGTADPAGEGFVTLGANYKISTSANVLTYTISPKKIYIDVDSIDASNPNALINAKYFDQEKIGGLQTYINKDNKTTNVDFSVRDLSLIVDDSNNYAMPTGYVLTFDLGSPLVNARDAAYPMMFENIIVKKDGIDKTTNFTISTSTDPAYKILRRPVVITPNNNVFDYIDDNSGKRERVFSSHGDEKKDMIIYDYIGKVKGEKTDINILAASYNITLMVVNAAGDSVLDANANIEGIQYDNKDLYKWKLVTNMNVAEYENFEFFVDKTVGVTIKQAKYFIHLPSNFKTGPITYSPANKRKSMSPLNEFGSDFDIINTLGQKSNIVGENGTTTLSLQYYKKVVDKYVPLTDDNFGVGEYTIMVDPKTFTNNTNFIITNYVNDGTILDNAIEKVTRQRDELTGEIKYDVVEKDPTYSIKVVPANIDVTLSSASYSFNSIDASMKNIFATNYTVRYYSDDVRIALESAFNPYPTYKKSDVEGQPDVLVPSNIKFNRVEKTPGGEFVKGEEIEYSDTKVLNVGKYRFDLSALQSAVGDNYKVNIKKGDTDGDTDIDITSVQLYVNFADRTNLVSRFENAEPTVPAVNEFYTIDGKKVTLVPEFTKGEGDALVPVQYIVNFLVRDAQGQPAIIVGENYNLKVDLSKSFLGVDGTTNYFISIDSIFSNTSFKTYEIKKAPLEIGIARVDKDTSTIATYDETKFNMVDSFRPIITGLKKGDTTVNDDLIKIFGSDAFGLLDTTSENEVKGQYSFRFNFNYDLDGGLASDFSISIENVTGIGELKNYAVTINRLDHFKLNKKKLTPSIDKTELIPPAEHKAEDFSIGWNIPTSIKIDTILSTVPTKTITVVPSENDMVIKYQVGITKDYGFKQTVGATHNVFTSYSQVYYIDSVDLDNLMDSFEVTKETVNITLGVDEKYSLKTNQDIKTKDAIPTYYVYGFEEFNPAVTTINAVGSPYVVAIDKNADAFSFDSTTFVVEGVESGTPGFLKYTISLDFTLQNRESYIVTLNGEAPGLDPNKITFSFFVRKAQPITIKLNTSLTGAVPYSSTYLTKNFSNTVTGLVDFDNENWSNITVIPSLVFASATEENNVVTLPAVIDGSCIATEGALEHYTMFYENIVFDNTATESVQYTKGVIEFDMPTDFSKTYSVDNIVDKNNTITATYKVVSGTNVGDVISDRDKSIIFKMEPTRNDNILEFVKGANGDYLVNSLDAGTYTFDAKNETANKYGKYFKVNEAFFNASNMLYNFDIKFNVVISACEVEVKLLYPNEKIIVDGKPTGTRVLNYKVEYGDNYGDIESIIKGYGVQIRDIASGQIISKVLDDASIIEIALDTKYDKTAMPAVQTYSDIVVTFKELNANYTIKGQKHETANVDVVPREIYYSMYVGDDATSDVLFSSTFGDITNAYREDLLLDDDTILGNINIVWYTKSMVEGKVVYTPINDAKKSLMFSNDVKPMLIFARNTANYNVGKYALNITNKNTSYAIAPIEETKTDGTMAAKNFYYEIKPLTVRLDLAKLPANIKDPVEYGMSYDAILNRFAISQDLWIAVVNATIGNNDCGFINLEKIVQNDILANLNSVYLTAKPEVVDPAPGTEVVQPVLPRLTGVTLADAGNYVITYETTYAVGAPVNIVLEGNTYDFVVNPRNIASEIVNKDIVAEYTGKFHDRAIAIEYVPGALIKPEEIYYTINGFAPIIPVMGQEPTGYIKDLGAYDVVVKPVPNATNFRGELKFTYTVNPLDLANVITNGDINATYNGTAFDVLSNIVIGTDLITANNLTYTVNGKAPLEAGEIKNVGTYAIEVSIGNIAENLKNNIVGTKKFNVIIGKRNVAFDINNSETNKPYGEGFTDILLSDITIDSGYDITYYTETGELVLDMTKMPIGKYKAVFTMREDANFTAKPRVFLFNLVQADVKDYIDKVTITSGATADVTYGFLAEYTTDGLHITLSTIDEVFGGYAADCISGMKVEAILGKEIIATSDTNTIVLPHGGNFTLRVTYTIKGDKITMAEGTHKDITISVHTINIDKNETVRNAIVVDGVEAVDGVYGYTFTGATPVFVLKNSTDAISYNDVNVNYFMFVKTNGEVATADETAPAGEWQACNGAPTAVGEYRANIDINDYRYTGRKEIYFNINKAIVPFELGTNSDSLVYDGAEHPITYTTDENLVIVEYFNGDTKMDTIPTNAGSYKAVASIRPEFVAKGDGEANVVFAGENPVLEFAYNITKANYDVSKVKYNKLNDSKVYDGKQVTIAVKDSDFTGLPEGATVELKKVMMKNAGKYNLKVNVSSANYETFTLDYGTYTVEKAKVNPTVKKKTETGITFNPIVYGRDVKVTYSIDGGKTYKEAAKGVIDLQKLANNTECDIMVKLEGRDVKKNFEETEFTIKASTVKTDTLSPAEIAIIGIASVGAVVLVVVFSVIMSIRRKRKI